MTPTYAPAYPLCAACGWMIRPTEGRDRSGDGWKHTDPRLCILHLTEDRDEAIAHAGRIVAELNAALPVLRAARRVRVRDWHYRRTEGCYDRAKGDDWRKTYHARAAAFWALEDAREELDMAVSAYAKGALR